MAELNKQLDECLQQMDIVFSFWEELGVCLNPFGTIDVCSEYL